MITTSDSPNTVDLGQYFAILPANASMSIDRYLEKQSAAVVDPEFSYNSGSNPEFLNVEQIRSLIRDHIDPAFSPA
jgi:hypothetical protein